MTDHLTALTKFLHSSCAICHHCIRLLLHGADSPHTESNDTSSSCSICLDLTSSSFQENVILPEMRRSLAPYCSSGGDIKTPHSSHDIISCNHGNYLSRESPTIQIPLLIQVRAHCAITAAKSFILSNMTSTLSKDHIKLHTAEHVYLGIKENIKSSLKELLGQSSLTASTTETKELPEHIPQQLHNEEAGYLSTHVIFLPPPSATLIPPSLELYLLQNMEQIQFRQYKILNPRKRFRGNDPTLKQGGDARKNLEMRLRRKDGAASTVKSVDGKRRRLNEALLTKDGMDSSVLNEMIPWLDKDTITTWCKNYDSGAAEWFQKIHASNKIPQSSHQHCSVHATTWRRPFCIHGYYTKTRRDVSQTPFYVSSLSEESSPQSNDPADEQTTHKSIMIRKGFSSVEEEICPQLSNGCGGISTSNNDPHSSALVYGMCKFHASGREDIDVRMILPCASAASKNAITGRPFVCEIIDAHRMPTLNDLKCVEDAINCQDDDHGNTTEVDEEIEWDEDGWPHSRVIADRSYGNNTHGVGVSSLTYVPSSTFSTLQSETENKVKYYGCMCWSQQPIDSDESLCQKLGCSTWDNDNDDTAANYPMEIKQNTPLRVLHRRSSDIRTRYILTLSARRIDKHWFKLRMSTSAGTYVKEFVHGDCGRTYPSVGSLLAGRVDITELDCEGIVI